MKKVLFFMALMVAQALSAQQMTYYSCDFEDPQEMQNWVINAGSRGQSSTNKWYVGAAGSFGINSTRGMYISTAADTTVCRHDASKSGYIVAYRPMTLEAGTYHVVFDWIGTGNTADSLYVFWVPATQNTNSNYSTSSPVGKPAWVPEDAVHVSGGSFWQSACGDIISDGTAGKLVILFYYAQGTNPLSSFAMDDIAIFQGGYGAPTGVHYNSNNSTLTWSGSNSSTYDVLVLNEVTKEYLTYPGLCATSCSLAGQMNEGYYHFYVRRTFTNYKHSPWVIADKFVWLKGTRCIDYLDLTSDNSGAAQCYWTQQKSSTQTVRNAGQKDYGCQDDRSLHTVHYDPNETDWITGHQLKTVPDGEIASVRVGSRVYAYNNYPSEIEYAYTVSPEKSNMLEVKYACVLDNPDHSQAESPEFKLEILRQDGSVIPCPRLDYYSGYGETLNWHQTQFENYPVLWSDWQSVYVNLNNYIGETLTIRIYASPCSFGGMHFGYAYFTIGCTSEETPDVCSFTIDHFQAPEGYEYSWYRAEEPDSILGDSSYFAIDLQDTAIYQVDLIATTQGRCDATMTFNPNPIVPIAEVTGSYTTQNDKYTVTFLNRCRAARVNRVTGREMQTESATPLTVQWDFGDGSPVLESNDSVVVHTYLHRDEDYQATITVSIDSGACVDSFTVTLPLHRIEYEVRIESEHGLAVGGGMYPADTTILLSIWPDDGYHFTCWNDSVTDNPRSVHLVSDTSFTALFAPNSYQFLVMSNDSAFGTVVGTSSGTYDYNTQIRVGAMPNPGYIFVQWDTGVTDNPYSFPLTADKALTAIFETETGLENPKSNPESATKVLINGILYIRRDALLYNAQGLRVE